MLCFMFCFLHLFSSDRSSYSGDVLSYIRMHNFLTFWQFLTTYIWSWAFMHNYAFIFSLWLVTDDLDYPLSSSFFSLLFLLLFSLSSPFALSSLSLGQAESSQSRNPECKIPPFLTKCWDPLDLSQEERLLDPNFLYLGGVRESMPLIFCWIVDFVKHTSMYVFWMPFHSAPQITLPIQTLEKLFPKSQKIGWGVFSKPNSFVQFTNAVATFSYNLSILCHETCSAKRLIYRVCKACTKEGFVFVLWLCKTDNFQNV